MEMNMAYFRATLERMSGAGFEVATESDTHTDQGSLVFTRTKALCSKGEACRLNFESLEYAAGQVDFYLEILAMGRMRSFSFPLDSWKHHADRIEFKYRADPQTGLGLALTMSLKE
jgi:hypothetical protein